MFDSQGISYNAEGGNQFSVDDTIILTAVESVNGLDGNDTLIIGDDFADMAIGISADGTVMVEDANGNLTTITNVEDFEFSDQTLDLAGLESHSDTRELFYEMVFNGVDYDQVYVLPDLFLFPENPALEAMYDYKHLGGTDGDIIVGSGGNDFINGLEGGDGIIAGDGNDVIDGGLGSNFLTGGNGDDVFFADGRDTANETWTTVTDFNTGTNSANIWGYVDGTSTYFWEASNGAAGWEGATLRCDLDGNGVVDTSMTFTGLTEAELTLTTASVAGLGYLALG